MIALACDHGGFDLKESIKKHLDQRGLAYKDYGCYDKSSCDYPDFVKPAAQSVVDGECEKGIVVCTTGIGISMCANKFPGIRCALCTTPTMARLTRLHNNANMLSLGAGIVGELMALEIVDTFLDTDFSNEDRHLRRVNKIEIN